MIREGREGIQMKIEKLLREMSVEEMVGQLLCFNVPPEMTEEEFEAVIERTKPGGIFVKDYEMPQVGKFQAMMKKYCRLPGLIAADLETGPKSANDGETMPNAMAQGACGDTALLHKLHKSRAEACRKAGVSLVFSPVVDININPDNPVTNVRAFSDSADHVIKMAETWVRAFQEDGLVMTTCKHFPGDGTDDRNQHFCTTINRLTADEWMESFGKVYKAMIKAETAAIMVGHISLPALQDSAEYDESFGYLPGTLSYSLQTKLLKERLGFGGCIISDAMSMVGACAAIPIDRLAIEFLKAGGDMLLYPLPEDYDRILEAVRTGEISMERLRDAAERVLRMKVKARLFEKEEDVQKDIREEYDIKALTAEVGEKCIKIVRNRQNLLPLQLPEKAKILLINIAAINDEVGLPVLEEELAKRGYIVKTLLNPRHYTVQEEIPNYDCVLVNCKITSYNYPGGSLRIGWDQVWPFWRGYIFTHPCMIFTSFGDPYKIYDFPYLRTYINAFSEAEGVQRGFVRVLLGEAEPTAKSPVALKGFFEREV
ncbi:MAG: glycoside hydrolase family 3 protein [Ruminococcaceae bacterium]|nr:glycoside hydrolase family 3 protein [Oscillospiraceae bacterium]